MAIALALTALLGNAADTAAQSTFNDAMAQLARDVKDYTSKNGTLKLIEEIPSPPDFPGNGGEGIRTKLLDELQKIGVKPTQTGSGCAVRCNYFAEVAKDGKSATLIIDATMVLPNGRAAPNFSYSAEITQAEDLVRLLGLNLDATPAPDKRAPTEENKVEDLANRRLAVASQIGDPSAARPAPTGPALVANPAKPDAPPTIVAPKAGSLFQMELCVLREDGPFPLPVVKDASNLAFVHLRLNDRYVVRIINRADFAVGVKLYIDGMSMFEFTEVPEYRRHEMVWIGPARNGVPAVGLIQGWHINDGFSDAFRIVDLPKAAVIQRRKKPDRIGSVTAEFFASWEPGQPPPAVEFADKSRGDSGVGTGIGERVAARYQRKEVEFGKNLLAAIAVRYQQPPGPEPFPQDLPSEK